MSNTAIENILVAEPAGFWRRFAAYFIDAIILGVCLQIPAQFILSHLIGPPLSVKLMATLTNVFTLCTVIYYVMFLTSHWQATPGKRIMNVYVVRADSHQRLSILQALARWLAFSGPMVLLLFLPFFSDFPGAVIPQEMQQKLQHMTEIQVKQSNKQPLSSDDQQFLKDFEKQAPDEFKKIVSTPGFWTMPMIGFISFLYGVTLIATVAFTTEKKGIHDMVAMTRALKGKL